MAEPRAVQVRRRRLNILFDEATRLSRLDDAAELEAEYARHLCVLVSGYVEKSIGEIIVEYARGKTARPLQSFVESTSSRLGNLDKEKLLAVIGRLDASWRDRVEVYVTDERQAALNSVVGLRNDIAHGGTAGVGLRQMRKYWVAVQEVVEKVAEVVLAPPRQPANTRRGRSQSAA